MEKEEALKILREDYVSFETAKLLKEKGFDESTSMVYVSYGDLCKLNKYDSIRNSNYNDITKNYFEYTAPTLQMAMKWLRENYKLHIDVDPSEGNWNPTVLELENWTCAVKFGDKIPIQDSYEQACEAAIKYCLENLI